MIHALDGAHLPALHSPFCIDSSISTVLLKDLHRSTSPSNLLQLTDLISTTYSSFVTSMACINSFLGTSPNILRSPMRSNTSSCRRNCRKLLKAPLASTFSCGPRLEMDENPEGIISGEWSENFSLLSYDDLRAYHESQRIKSSPKTQGMAAGVSEVMSTPVRTAMSDQTLEEVAHHFEAVSTLPVVDGNLICIGVISKNDQAKASNGLQTRIGEMMSSPAITLSEDKTVMDAAALMLKSKVHRIPVVNKERRVIGIITRKDVLQELEALLK